MRRNSQGLRQPSLTLRICLGSGVANRDPVSSTHHLQLTASISPECHSSGPRDSAEVPQWSASQMQSREAEEAAFIQKNQERLGPWLLLSCGSSGPDLQTSSLAHRGKPCSCTTDLHSHFPVQGNPAPQPHHPTGRLHFALLSFPLHQLDLQLWEQGKPGGPLNKSTHSKKPGDSSNLCK